MSIPRNALIGYVVQSPSPNISQVAADTPIPIGSYVYARFDIRSKVSGEYKVREVVGLVTNTAYQPVIPQSTLALISETDPDKIRGPSYSPVNIYVIADVTEGEATPPIYPIPPNTPIYLAEAVSPNPLERIYRRSDPSNRLIRIGSLARYMDQEVAIDANRLYKHLLITGATGSGKSNAVAIIVDRLSSQGAPVIIFDVHGEYRGLEPEDGRKDKVVVIDAMINPLRIRLDMLARIAIPEAAATKQRRIFKRIIRNLKNELYKKAREEKTDLKIAIDKLLNHRSNSRSGSRLKELLQEIYELEEEEADQKISRLSHEEKLSLLILNKIEQMCENKRDKDVCENLHDKLVDFFNSYRIISLEASSPVDRLSPGRIIVYDVSGLSDDQKSWLLKTLVEDLLDHLKETYRIKGSAELPVVLVIEEAPLFISRDRASVASESIRRFAREGRKFGGVLVISSQRPRVLDPDISSQIQNYLFLKLVQEDDIRSVMNIADYLEENLARTLTSLPTGWGLVMGEWIGRFPALVAIDRHLGKKLGASPDLVGSWRGALESSERRKETPQEFEF
ncbi:MAG: ATP-binding protein [Sulfolobales archaeon]